jgi:hypothetical protein
MVLCGTTWATLQEKNPKRVQRVKRPVFTQRDWDGIYFEDLFEEGLVGNRPEPEQLASPITGNPSEQAAAGVDSTTFAWNRFIANDVIEDEIKSAEQALRRDVTTPVEFKSGYAKARQSFSMLSLMFGIIREYESEDIRWKKYAPAAQAAFARAAGTSRVGTEQAYQSAKRNTENLTELVRGGAFATTDPPPEELLWPQVVDRNPMMVRLQVAIDKLKPATANKTEFINNIDLVYHEASIVAAIGQALVRKDMEEADEEGYAAFAITMSTAATDLVTATRNRNFDGGSTAVNVIEQSCTNCHGEWR